MIAFTTQAISVLTLDSKTEKEDLIESLAGKELSKKNRIVLLTPIDFKRLFPCFSDFQLHWIVLDKLDMHLSMDLKEDLLECAEQVDGKERAKFIISTNSKDKLDEESKEVRTAFTKGEKALVIRLNEEIRQKTAFERIEHLYIKCMKESEKYLALFSMIKLGIVEGKSLIYCNEITTAYKIKIFLNKF